MDLHSTTYLIYYRVRLESLHLPNIHVIILRYKYTSLYLSHGGIIFVHQMRRDYESVDEKSLS